MPRLRPIRDPEKTVDDKTAQVDDATRKERRERWASLNSAITNFGGWVVSIPGMRRMRIECREGCNLAEKLETLGYAVDRRGTGSRLVGSEGRDGTINVEIIEISLPR